MVACVVEVNNTACDLGFEPITVGERYVCRERNKEIGISGCRVTVIGVAIHA